MNGEPSQELCGEIFGCLNDCISGYVSLAISGGQSYSRPRWNYRFLGGVS
jgi:hypothetical protein